MSRDQIKKLTELLDGGWTLTPPPHPPPGSPVSVWSPDGKLHQVAGDGKVVDVEVVPPPAGPAP